MTTKLILIEGLPGFGKTTSAQLVHEILDEMKVSSQLFLEGNLDHPADFDGVAHFHKPELNELLRTYTAFEELLRNHMFRQSGHYFVEYRKLQKEHGASLPDELLRTFYEHDIYELPLAQNRQLITERWKQFTADALNGPDIFVFDCCFIQNPVTAGMIKYDADKEEVISYVTELATIAKPLEPLLIYVEQNDPEYAFKKAVKERAADWSEGFIEYYTGQGYGKNRGYQGLKGTLQVLLARRDCEAEIIGRIPIAKQKVDNSANDAQAYKQVLTEILSGYFG